MAKYRIRENELRNLVREAIDEVVIDGQSYHGKDPKAWKKVADKRRGRMSDIFDAQGQLGNNPKANKALDREWDREHKQFSRNAKNYFATGGKTQHSQKESRSRRGSRLYESKSSDDIRQAYELLNGVVNSGFIPFSSPNPSSTEVVIKRSVMRAMDELMKAMDACRDCGY